MIEDELQLPVGTTIQLQQESGENNQRYKVRLIGYLPGKNIIVTNPEVNGRTVILKDDKVLIARIFKGSMAIGFRCRVMQTSLVPYPHLHLSYPNDLEISAVRNASRVNTKEAALVRNLAKPEDKFSEALILDLSTTGTKIATRHPIAQKGDFLQIRMKLNVDKEDRLLEMAGEVMKVNYQEASKSVNNKPVFNYGIKLKGVNAMQKMIIHAYVLEGTLG